MDLYPKIEPHRTAILVVWHRMVLFGEVLGGVWVLLCLLFPCKLTNLEKVRYNPWLSFILRTDFNFKDSASVASLSYSSAGQTGGVDLVHSVMGALLV